MATDAHGRVALFGEGVRAAVREQAATFARTFPELTEVRDVTIVRDRRHRARIDRVRSLERAGAA